MKKELNITNYYRLLPVVFCLLLSSHLRAQVTIGASIEPNKGAFLDLKQRNPDTNNTTSDKGLLLPRVQLTDLNKLYPMFTGSYNDEENAKHIGLTVYNAVEAAGIPAGLYVWDGAKWAGINVEIKPTLPIISICDPLYYEPDPTKSVAITVDVPDEFGNSTGKKTLRFLTYNLGANPNMTVKQQMAYTSDPAFPNPAEDMTVFGGAYQWGRKDPEHSFRCYGSDGSDPDVLETLPEYFTKTPYSSIPGDPNYYDPETSHAFVYGQVDPDDDWITPKNPDLWGNGLDIGNGGNGEIVDGKVVPPGKTEYDPCPNGYRVPTQYEWALLGREAGKPDSYENDQFAINSNSTTDGAVGFAPDNNPGITWVHVSGGKIAASNWNVNDVTMHGYALYYTDIWRDAANDDYRYGEKFLTDPAAPEPLMFLPAAGWRNHYNGVLTNVGINGRYWAVTGVNTGKLSLSMIFVSGIVQMNYYMNARAGGRSVRCIAE